MFTNPQSAETIRIAGERLLHVARGWLHSNAVDLRARVGASARWTEFLAAIDELKDWAITKRNPPWRADLVEKGARVARGQLPFLREFKLWVAGPTSDDCPRSWFADVLEFATAAVELAE